MGARSRTDEDGDGVPGCIDACPADPDKSGEREGSAGAGVADTDTDDDDRYDWRIDQCPLDPSKSGRACVGVGWLTRY